MIELTVEQGRTVESGDIAVVDPRTKVHYVLLRADVYERLKSLLDLDPRDTYPTLDEVFGQDWNDPKMAEYDRYEEHRK